MDGALLDYKKVVNSYLNVSDWRVKENSTVTSSSRIKLMITIPPFSQYYKRKGNAPRCTYGIAGNPIPGESAGRSKKHKQMPNIGKIAKNVFSIMSILSPYLGICKCKRRKSEKSTP